MALVIRVVIQRFLNAIDTVFEHALAGEGERAKRKSALMVFSWNKFVNALLGKKLGPQVPVTAVYCQGVIGVKAA
jgi:hypothetical protein